MSWRFVVHWTHFSLLRVDATRVDGESISGQCVMGYFRADIRASLAIESMGSHFAGAASLRLLPHSLSLSLRSDAVKR